MTREEMSEDFSEELGFRLSTGKSGVQLFDQAVDFEVPSILESPLHLLHVGHAKKLYAASNGQAVGIGQLDDLDGNDADAKENFKAVPLANVTYLRFDCTNDYLYVLSDGVPKKAAVNDFVNQGSSTFTSLGSYSAVSVLEPSPVNPSTFCLLNANCQVIIVQNGSETLIEDAVAFSWAYSGQEVVVLSQNGLKFVSTNGVESTACPVEEGGKLFSVSTIDENNWYVVGVSEEDEEDETHTLVTRSGAGFISQDMILPPPFSDTPRAPSKYVTTISEWQENSSLAFIANALGSEVITLELGSKARLLSVNDTDRAELPMDELSDEDTQPVGIALDLSGTARTIQNPSPSIDEAVGVLPRLLCLNNMGRLFAWNIFDVSGVRENELDLHRAVERLPKVGGIEEGKKALPSARKSSIISNDFAKSLNPELPSLDGLSVGGQASEKASSGPSFGQIKPASSGFGATGFGANANSKPMFGSGDFSTKSSTTEAKPAFSSTGFGTQTTQTTSGGFGSSGFGNSGFGSLGNSGSGFGNSGKSGSGFGSGAVFGQSSFGSQKSDTATSNNLPSNSASAHSSFGSNSKFGASSATAQSSSSSFAGLSKSGTSDSPFAGLMKSDKPSPFDGTSGTDSSTVLGDEKPNLSSLSIGSDSGQKGSWLSEPKQKTSFLDAGSNASPSPFQSLKNDKPSPFGNAEKSSSSPFDILKTENQASPSGLSNSLATASLTNSANLGQQKSPFGSASNQLSDSDEDTATQSESESESGSVSSEASEDRNTAEPVFAEKNKFAQSNSGSSATKSIGFGQSVPDLTTSGSSVPQNSRLSNLYEMHKATKEATAIDKTISAPQKGENTASKLLFGSHEKASSDTPKLVASSISKKERVNQEVAKVSGSVAANKQSVSASPQNEEKKRPSQAHQDYEGKNIAEIFEEMRFLKFDGFEEDPSLPENEVERLFVELVQRVQGHLDVLSLNADKAATLINAAAVHRKSLDESDLADKTRWALGDVEDLTKLAANPREPLEEMLILLRHQDTKLARLLQQVSETEDKRENMTKVLASLASYKQSLTSTEVTQRPLDARAESLRLRLRQKLAHVESLQEEMDAKMLPLGVRLNLGQSSVARVTRIENVVRELSSRARALARYVERLESEVQKVCEEKEADLASRNSDAVPLLLGFNNDYVDRFALAEKFSKGVIPRKVTPTRI